MLKNFLYLIIMVSIIVISGCEGEKTKETIKAKNAVLQTMEMQYRKDAVLLSLKYKVDENTVFDIISEKDRILLDVLDGKPKSTEDVFALYSKHAREKISAYHEKYEIPEDIIANILIDYYAMNCKKGE